jgi:hypothetical protein
MNNWWGRSGGGAPAYTNRRHNVHNVFEKSRPKWVKLFVFFFLLSII